MESRVRRAAVAGMSVEVVGRGTLEEEKIKSRGTQSKNIMWCYSLLDKGQAHEALHCLAGTLRL